MVREKGQGRSRGDREREVRYGGGSKDAINDPKILDPGIRRRGRGKKGVKREELAAWLEPQVTGERRETVTSEGD